jgi:hypothetical protein
MNQKQFANVLIKVLGIYFLVDGVIRIFSGVISLFSAMIARGISGIYLWATPVIGIILAIIGFLLIVLSQPIADLLFKDE